MQIALDIFLFLIYISCFLLLCLWTWKFWLLYANQKHLDDLDWKLLEIRLPREIFKSPQATEMAAAAFLQAGGVGTWYNKYVKGALPIFFSLEIASLEGDVKFFVRTQKKFVQLIQNNFYSQYPNIEITEADDYVTKIYYDHRSPKNGVGMWASDYFLSSKFTIKDGDKEKKIDDVKIKNDPLPMKTYVDFGLDKDPKEEFKHDPLTPILEWFGSLKKGEYAWYQIMVQDESNYNNKKFPGFYINETDHSHITFSDLVKLRLNSIRKTKPKYKKGDQVLDDYGNPKTKTKKVKQQDGSFIDEEVPVLYAQDDKGSDKKDNDLTEEEKNEIKLILRKAAKPAVLCAMRVVYIAAPGSFNAQNIQSILNVPKHFSAPGFNTFGLSPADPYDYDWQDFMKRRRPWRKEEFFEAYVEREAFYPHIESRTKGSKPRSFVDIDDWWDWALFTRSLGFRKIGRIMWEGFFYPTHHPHADNAFVLNLEELATLWHLPGATATTPGIRRVDSVKGDAPNNLPI